MLCVALLSAFVLPIVYNWYLFVYMCVRNHTKQMWTNSVWQFSGVIEFCNIRTFWMQMLCKLSYLEGLLVIMTSWPFAYCHCDPTIRPTFVECSLFRLTRQKAPWLAIVITWLSPSSSVVRDVFYKLSPTKLPSS